MSLASRLKSRMPCLPGVHQPVSRVLNVDATGAIYTQGCKCRPDEPRLIGYERGSEAEEYFAEKLLTPRTGDELVAAGYNLHDGATIPRPRGETFALLLY